jgi:hypothetical protein
MLSTRSVNKRKYNIFASPNVIGTTTFSQASAETKLQLMAKVGRAMRYMSSDTIEEIMVKTAENVETTLLQLGKELVAANSSLIPKGSNGAPNEAFLKEEHRRWLRSHITAGNERVWKKFPDWANSTLDAIQKRGLTGPKIQRYVSFLSGINKRTASTKVPGFKVQRL